MPQINKPSSYFNTVLYTGNGTDNHAITGVGFQPDLVWGKARNAVLNHWIQNSVSGGTNYMYVNATDAEATASTVLKTFDSDGFTLGTATSWNGSGNNFASWNWLAGGTASSNTDGSITSSVSANTTSGFSIVSYTGNGTNGASIGHGLGTTPAFWILKNRSSGTNQKWIIGHKSLSNSTDKYMDFSNAAEQTASGIFGIGSSTLTFTTSYDATNMSGETCIGYFFAEKKGFSKFGSYTGNNSSDGVFLYLGFKPSLFIVKKYSASGTDWLMYDNKRNEYNQLTKTLESNTSDAETTTSSRDVDFCSNGIKLRGASAAVNDTGSFIYLAFAESPLVGTNNIPATAR